MIESHFSESCIFGGIRIACEEELDDASVAFAQTKAKSVSRSSLVLVLRRKWTSQPNSSGSQACIVADRISRSQEATRAVWRLDVCASPGKGKGKDAGFGSCDMSVKIPNRMNGSQRNVVAKTKARSD